MQQNLTNFFNLIKTRKIKTTLADSDLIAVGTRDFTWSGNYQPTAITFEDLQNQLGTLSVTTTGTGGASTFAAGVLNIPVYQTQIPHLEYNNSNKTVWCNGIGNNSENTNFGEGTLANITFGSKLTAFGISALGSNTNGSFNTAFGSYALQSNTTGGDNNAFGAFALWNNTTGSYNTAIGDGTLTQNINGNNNTACGVGSLNSNTSGANNTSVGTDALRANTGGNGNTALGRNSLWSNTNGISNTAVGGSALLFNTTGIYNAALGEGALQSNTTGNYNTAIGRLSLRTNTTGNDNTAVGANTSSGNFSSSVILGRDAAATANNQFVVGSQFYNAGTITTETITPDKTWTVRINGQNYKIPLLLI